MSQNIEKALYIGIALLLFAFALTAFFVEYGQFQTYIGESEKKMSQDMMVEIEKNRSEIRVSGHEVIHQAVAVKRLMSLRISEQKYGEASGQDMTVAEDENPNKGEEGGTVEDVLDLGEVQIPNMVDDRIKVELHSGSVSEEQLNVKLIKVFVKNVSVDLLNLLSVSPDDAFDVDYTFNETGAAEAAYYK